MAIRPAWQGPERRDHGFGLRRRNGCRNPLLQHRLADSIHTQTHIMIGDASELPGFTSIPEPDLMFAAGGLDKHPLRGLIEHGPFGLKYGTPATVRFALIGPTAQLRQ